jgi:hypothetical protein
VTASENAGRQPRGPDVGNPGDDLGIYDCVRFDTFWLDK